MSSACSSKAAGIEPSGRIPTWPATKTSSVPDGDHRVRVRADRRVHAGRVQKHGRHVGAFRAASCAVIRVTLMEPRISAIRGEDALTVDICSCNDAFGSSPVRQPQATRGCAMTRTHSPGMRSLVPLVAMAVLAGELASGVTSRTGCR